MFFSWARCIKYAAIPLAFVLVLSSCALKTNKNNLIVDITSFLGDDQSFQENDSLSFLMSLNKDAWLYLYYENAEGKVYQLIPSLLYQDNMVKAGDFIEFPSADADFEIKISPPFGTEKVWLVASNEGLDDELHFNTNLDELNLEFDGVKSKLLSIAKKKNAHIAEDSLRFISTQSASEKTSPSLPGVNSSEAIQALEYSLIPKVVLTQTIN